MKIYDFEMKKLGKFNANFSTFFTSEVKMDI